MKAKATVCFMADGDILVEQPLELDASDGNTGSIVFQVGSFIQGLEVPEDCTTIQVTIGEQEW